MKRIPMFILSCGLLLATTTSALASGAPTSQFGFKGWPYKAETPCDTAGTCMFDCSECQSNDDCCFCPVCSVTPTPDATKEPTVTPTPVVTEKPTAEPTPIATEEPTVTPTPVVTEKPTAEPTPVVTQAPTVKPTPEATATPIVTPQPTAAPTATIEPSPTSTVDYTTDSILAQEQTMLNLLNQDRASQGLSALTLDTELSRIARIKSCDMNENNYFAHTSPTYGSAADMLKQFGYSYSAVGENIAHHATVDKAQSAFMSSDGHRRNILGSNWTKVGIGVCYDAQGYVYVTQMFVR